MVKITNKMSDDGESTKEFMNSIFSNDIHFKKTCIDLKMLAYCEVKMWVSK